MKVIIFDAMKFEKEHFQKANESLSHELYFYEGKLSVTSAVLASGYDCVCAFVNDCLNEDVLEILAAEGVKLIALRSAGFNHVNLKAAARLGLKVVRVPEYSPYAVAEHAFALILTLNRKIHRAYNRVREGNFSLEGLVGFDLHGRTIGVIGTGRIGRAFIKIARGFGMTVLAYDNHPSDAYAKELDFTYTSLDEVLKKSDIISLHVPLMKETHHMINKESIEKMKDGVMLINTSRGGLIDTKAIIDSLKSGKIGSSGLDVYEEEEKFFFQDLSNISICDDVLARLMTFPNVVLTSHQGFLTTDALGNIASTTMTNIDDFAHKRPLVNEVTL